jgi:hypothetical protein
MPESACGMLAAPGMNAAFQFEYLWHDNDVLQVRISAWNGQFGGSSDVYVGLNELSEAAAKLEGFPRQLSDACELLFGAFGPEWVGGGASMRFFCGDAAGHAFVEARIESDCTGSQKAQSVVLSALIEPADIDTFIPELRRLEADRKGTARLKISGQEPGEQ